MIDITEAFRNLIEQAEKEKSEEVYKLKTINFNQPFMLIGIDLITKARRIYIDITERDFNDEQMKSFPKWKGVFISKEYFERIGPLKEKDFLIIAQDEEKSEEIFEDLLQSLVDHIVINDQQPLFTVIYEVLDRWYNFFRFKSNKRLSLEEQMGVFGELYYIVTWLKKFPKEPPLIIDAWKGPTRHRVDFVKKNIGVEIKTLSPKIHEGIRISNEKQLELSNVIQKIYLYVLKIEDTQAEGESIQDLIDTIRSQLNERSQTSLVRFNDLLFDLYILDDVYNDIYFYVHNEETYQVTSEFPKLISSNLPVGISNISYTIDLSHCIDYKVDTDKAYLSKEG